VFLSDGWCGLLSSCPVSEGHDVEIGCYVQYEWLSYRPQQNPIADVNSSIEFTDDPTSFFWSKPPRSRHGNASETLMKTRTIRNVQPGQILSHTCRVRFDFDLSSHSARNTHHAVNELEWTCTVRETVTSK